MEKLVIILVILLVAGCEVKIRAFYVDDFIVFVFGNDSKALACAVLERTKEYIREYNALYPLDKGDSERFSDILTTQSLSESIQ